MFFNVFPSDASVFTNGNHDLSVYKLNMINFYMENARDFHNEELLSIGPFSSQLNHAYQPANKQFLRDYTVNSPIDQLNNINYYHQSMKQANCLINPSVKPFQTSHSYGKHFDFYRQNQNAVKKEKTLHKLTPKTNDNSKPYYMHIDKNKMIVETSQIRERKISHKPMSTKFNEKQHLINPHGSSNNFINIDMDSTLLKENPLDYLYTASEKEVNNTNCIKNRSHFGEYFNKISPKISNDCYTNDLDKNTRNMMQEIENFYSNLH
jgi:hypothetical protein